MRSRSISSTTAASCAGRVSEEHPGDRIGVLVRIEDVGAVSVEHLGERCDQTFSILAGNQQGRDIHCHATAMVTPGSMTKIKLGVVLAALAAGTMTSMAQPAKPVAAATPNFVELADRIVGKTANVKEGEIVEVAGGPADMVFLEELAVAVRKRGAFPILTVWSESAAKKELAGVDEKYDGKTDAGALALAKVVNVIIALPAVRDESIYEKLTPARRTARTKANQIIGETLRKRNVRQIELSNGMAPSPSRAKALGLSEAELTTVFWAGLGADYSAVETTAKTMQDKLAKGGELHITMANGTDFKVKIKGRKVLVSDGVISDADAKAGGPGVQAWLPAGEVYMTVVPGTAEGKIVDDRMVSMDKEILGVTAEFKAGKLTTITAKSGWDAVKPFYDAAGAMKNEVGIVDFGINPAVKAGGKFENFVSAGMVTIVTGNNLWAGGTNKEPFSLAFQFGGSTVTLDGKPFIDVGSIK